jgi:hypothetical protein
MKLNLRDSEDTSRPGLEILGAHTVDVGHGFFDRVREGLVDCVDGIGVVEGDDSARRLTAQHADAGTSFCGVASQTLDSSQPASKAALRR